MWKCFTTGKKLKVLKRGYFENGVVITKIGYRMFCQNV